jgi:L,D-transpeptidase YcbB
MLLRTRMEPPAVIRRLASITLPVLLLASQPAAAAAPVWSRSDAEQLLSYVLQIGAEGLDPSDYDADALRRDLQSDDPQVWSTRATAVFEHVAADLSRGHVRERRSVGWHISAPPFDASAARSLLNGALTGAGVQQSLESLLPTHRQYTLLKAALSATPPRDRAGIERLRANLERWRWMPRELGHRYLLVNVPAFTVSLVENGRVVERRRVIVGKRSTPTPQFNASVTGVIINPWWEVPQSVVRESVGGLLRTNPAQARARGYRTSKGRVRQAPGPANALGQVKLVMPNPFTVYLHDTPNNELFDHEVRAFSHGCIRTQDALGLAASLLRGTPHGSRAAIEQVVVSRRTTQLGLSEPLPVYITYFTAAAEETGDIATFPDIYGRDGPVVAGLVDRQVDSIP